MLIYILSINLVKVRQFGLATKLKRLQLKMEGIVFETVCREIKTHRANPTTLPITNGKWTVKISGNG